MEKNPAKQENNANYTILSLNLAFYSASDSQTDRENINTHSFTKHTDLSTIV